MRMKCTPARTRMFPCRSQLCRRCFCGDRDRQQSWLLHKSEAVAYRIEESSHAPR